MKKHPHVPHAVGESAIALFAKYERTRDGRMRPHEFVKAMQAYGKVLGTQQQYKRSVLERAFGSADSTRTGSLSIGDFIRYVGQGGVLHVNPVALATAAGNNGQDDETPWDELMDGAGGGSKEAQENIDSYALGLRDDLERP